ncbi:MAG: acyl-CoA dehydrogenase family protein, partial [Peptococcaceae bacterium]|nr:acyl-CoA dehydrogenase family protein [Peptococcaceae bacterium]
MSDALLSPKHLEIQKKAREFAREHIMPVAKELDAKGEYPWEIWKKIVDMGWG